MMIIESAVADRNGRPGPKDSNQWTGLTSPGAQQFFRLWLKKPEKGLAASPGSCCRIAPNHAGGGDLRDWGRSTDRRRIGPAVETLRPCPLREAAVRVANQDSQA